MHAPMYYKIVSIFFNDVLDITSVAKNQVIFCMMISCVFFLYLAIPNIVYGEEPPRKQADRGIEIEHITCKPGYTLVILQSEKIACLSEPTFLKLNEREYIKSVIHVFEQEKIKITDDIKMQDLQETTMTKNMASSSVPQITNIPASGGSIVNFYITDPDLNIAHGGVEVIPTSGLLEFTINGVVIQGPETMIETGPDTGQFYVKLQLPDSINGRPISQDDIVEIRYIDESDMSGEQRISTKSIPLGKTYAQLQTSGGGKTRIGHEFVVRIYEPDANLDSRDVNRISLSKFEYRGEGGIRTILSNPVFDANASYMLETGENTGVFEVIIKIPRTIDGKTVHIGDWYEIRYVDQTTPSNTSEEIKIKGKIG